MKKKILLLFILVIACVKMSADTVLWTGSTNMGTSWSACVNIQGSLFSDIKSGDVVSFKTTVSSNAQMQISYGSSWTNINGDCFAITGDYVLVVTDDMVSKLKQGIHVKGQNYTLTSVSIVSSSSTTTQTGVFSFSDFFVSGGTKTGSSPMIVNVLSRGGAGWYWPDNQDVSKWKSIVFTFSQATSKALKFQILYDDASVKDDDIPAGSTNYTYTLSGLTTIYSVNFYSTEAQTIYLKEVAAMDSNGDVVTGIKSTDINDAEVVGTQYFNLSGMRQSGLQRGINIIRMQKSNGQVVTKKVSVK